MGEVTLGGRRDRVIRVNVKPDRMAAYKLGASDLIAAFNREHVTLPGGFLVSDQAEIYSSSTLSFITSMI